MAQHDHQSLKIIERCSISPPPNSIPPTSIPLTYLDLPWFYLPPIQRIFFYELPQRNQILESVVPALKNSLSLTLQHFFPFAGNIVVPLHQHNNILPHILYSNGDSVSFTVAESNQDFKSFVDHAPTDLKDINLLVPVFHSPRTTQDGAKLLPLLAVQQMIVHPEMYSDATMNYIRERYMGLADKIVKIYVPMHVGNHWYLMIVDLEERKLIYLDSLKSEDAKVFEVRIGLMMEVARYLESMLSDDTFWDNAAARRSKVGDFEPEFPETGRQEEGTMDCGVWVCEWINNSHLWQDYTLEVNVITRMTIAMDLVTSPHNPLAEVISERAVNYWDAEMLRNYKEHQARKGKGKSTMAGPGSPEI